MSFFHAGQSWRFSPPSCIYLNSQTDPTGTVPTQSESHHERATLCPFSQRTSSTLTNRSVLPATLTPLFTQPIPTPEGSFDHRRCAAMTVHPSFSLSVTSPWLNSADHFNTRKSFGLTDSLSLSHSAVQPFSSSPTPTQFLQNYTYYRECAPLFLLCPPQWQLPTVAYRCRATRSRRSLMFAKRRRVFPGGLVCTPE